jgi:hypothetical protein
MTAKRGVKEAFLLGLAALLAPGAGHAGPARERRLHLVSAEASSYLVNDWNRFQENYLPLYVGDDDPHTAWSLKTEGIGEWIRMHVTPMQEATHVRMKIRNGFQKSERLFAANSRARALTVVLLPSKKTVEVDLTDTFGWQEIAVDQPPGPLDAIELQVKAVYPGKKYDDLCLSDVQLYVTATSSDNPAYEKQHFDKIVTWKKERAAAASLFKTAMGKTLPIAAQYQVSDLPAPPPGADADDAKVVIKGCASGDACWIGQNVARAIEVGGHDGKHAGVLHTAEGLAQAKFAGMTAVRISAQDKRPIPTVDGLCTPTLDSCEEDPCDRSLPLPMSRQLGYLRADGLALIEQTALPSVAEAQGLKPAQCHARSETTFAWALRDTTGDGNPGRLRAVLLMVCGVKEGREGSYPAGRSQLLVYGDSGQLELVADSSGAALLDWDQATAGAKLARASLTRAQGGSDLLIEADPAVAAK